MFPYYITLVFLILWFRPGRFSLSKWCSATALSVTVLRGSVPWFWQPVSAPLTHSLSPSVSFDPFTSPFLRAHCDAHVLQSEWPSEYVSSVPTSHLLIACLYTHTCPWWLKKPTSFSGLEFIYLDHPLSNLSWRQPWHIKEDERRVCQSVILLSPECQRLCFTSKRRKKRAGICVLVCRVKGEQWYMHASVRKWDKLHAGMIVLMCLCMYVSTPLCKSELVLWILQPQLDAVDQLLPPSSSHFSSVILSPLVLSAPPPHSLCFSRPPSFSVHLYLQQQQSWASLLLLLLLLL